MGPWSRRRGVPAPGGIPDRVAHTAIAVMGGMVAWGAVDGARTGGRSRFYQTLVLAYGLHGFSHLGSSVVFRGYSPGVLTVPITVFPYWWWASRELERAGVRRPARELLPQAGGLFAGALVACFGAAFALDGALRARARARERARRSRHAHGRQMCPGSL